MTGSRKAISKFFSLAEARFSFQLLTRVSSQYPQHTAKIYREKRDTCFSYGDDPLRKLLSQMWTLNLWKPLIRNVASHTPALHEAAQRIGQIYRNFPDKLQEVN